jgi:hypothetical protein
MVQARNRLLPVLALLALGGCTVGTGPVEDARPGAAMTGAADKQGLRSTDYPYDDGSDPYAEGRPLYGPGGYFGNLGGYYPNNGGPSGIYPPSYYNPYGYPYGYPYGGPRGFAICSGGVCWFY